MIRAIVLIILAAGIVALLAASPSPVSVMAQDATLDAAVQAIYQATARAQATRNAEAALIAAQRATAAALSVQQTRSAMEATRSYQATSAALDVQSTRQALDLQATADRQRQDATATRQAISLDATRQAATSTAIMGEFQAAATREAIQRQAQTESDRATLQNAGIILLFIIGAGLAGLAARGLWRIAPRKPIVIVESEQETQPATEVELPPIPPTRVVYDESAAQRIGEILEAQ